jgi:hypothetical protein
VLELAEAALAQAKRADSFVGAARAHALLGDVLAALGRRSEASPHRVAAIEHMRSLGDRRTTAELLLALAREDVATGAPDRARARLLEAAELAQALEWSEGLQRSRTSLSALG